MSLTYPLNTKLSGTVGNFLLLSFGTNEFYLLSLSFRIFTYNILPFLLQRAWLLVLRNTFMPVILNKIYGLLLPSTGTYHKYVRFPGPPSVEHVLTEISGRQKAHLKWETEALVPTSNPTANPLRILSVQLLLVSEEQKEMQKFGVIGQQIDRKVPSRKGIYVSAGLLAYVQLLSSLHSSVRTCHVTI